MKKQAILFFSALLFTLLPQLVSADKIRVGISTTLTGEVASLGTDSKNAIEFANEALANGRFKFVVEDDKCTGKDAVTVAKKLIEVSKVKFVLGVACNQVILSAGPLYQKAGVVVITSSATTGDVTGIGNKIFRPFPSDVFAAKELYDYIAPRHKKIGILTEENEYPVLMERSFIRFNNEASHPREIIATQIQMGEADQRSPLTKFKGAGVDALFINAGGEPALIRAVQQLKQLNFSPKLYGAYIPGSKTALDTLGNDAEGIIYADTQSIDSLLTEFGRRYLGEFKKRYGEPISLPIQVPLAMESVRLLAEALDSGRPVEEYLHNTKFKNTLVGDYSFDADGAIEGIGFRMFEIKSGKTVELPSATK